MSVLAPTARVPLGRFLGSGRFWLIAPSFLMIVVLVLLPVSLVLSESFRHGGALSFENYVQFFTQTQYLSTLRTTMIVAALTTVVVIAIAVPLCAFISTRSSPALTMVLGCVVLSLAISGLIRTLSWQIVLSREGPLNAVLVGAGVVDQPVYMLFTRGAVIAGTVQVMLPYAIVVILTAMRRVDREFVFVAGSLGSSPWTAFWQAYWPQIRRSIFNAALLVFVLSSGFIITPALLGGTGDMMIGNLMLADLNSGSPDGRAMAATSGVVLSLLLLVAAVVSVALGGKAFNRRGGGK